MPSTDTLTSTAALDILVDFLEHDDRWTDQRSPDTWGRPDHDHCAVLPVSDTALVITATGMTDADGDPIDIMAVLNCNPWATDPWTVGAIRYRLPDDSGRWCEPGDRG